MYTGSSTTDITSTTGTQKTETTTVSSFSTDKLNKNLQKVRFTFFENPTTTNQTTTEPEFTVEEQNSTISNLESVSISPPPLAERDDSGLFKNIKN